MLVFLTLYSCFLLLLLFLGPEAELAFAQLVQISQGALFLDHFRLPPVDGQLAKLVDQPLLFDHGQVALPSLVLVPVVVAHGPRHLLVVHLLAAVGLHATPRLGELGGVADLEDARRLVDPADDLGVVGVVVEHVPDENVEGRQWDLGSVLPGATTLALGTVGCVWIVIVVVIAILFLLPLAVKLLLGTVLFLPLLKVLLLLLLLLSVSISGGLLCCHGGLLDSSCGSNLLLPTLEEEHSLHGCQLLVVILQGLFES